MTFLEICQMVRREAGLSGDGPAAVTGQSGQMQKVVKWTIQAWQAIQTIRPNWNFLWSESGDLSLASAQGIYDPDGDWSVTDLEEVDSNTMLIYKTSDGVDTERELEYLPWKDFRGNYARRADAVPDNYPQAWTVRPDGDFQFHPVPDDTYTINFDYRHSIQVFAADADTPTGLPLRFHEIIAWRALMYFGFHEDAP